MYTYSHQSDTKRPTPQVAAPVRSALVSIQTAVSLRSTLTPKLISAMQAQNRASFSAQAAFDGVKNLFTTKKLNDGAVSSRNSVSNPHR